MTLWRKPRTGSGRQRGAAQVEFALSLMVILFTMFGTWEILMAVYTASVLNDAAREGVRYAIVHGANSSLCSGPNPSSPCTYDPSAANVVAAVNQYAKASFHDISKISITVTYPDGSNSAPSRVEVTVQYQFVPYINLSYITPTLRTKAAGRIVN